MISSCFSSVFFALEVRLSLDTSIAFFACFGLPWLDSYSSRTKRRRPRLAQHLCQWERNLLAMHFKTLLRYTQRSIYIGSFGVTPRARGLGQKNVDVEAVKNHLYILNGE